MWTMLQECALPHSSMPLPAHAGVVAHVRELGTAGTECPSWPGWIKCSVGPWS
jgi:hypothetical protein